MQKFIPFAESSCQNSTFCNCLGGIDIECCKSNDFHKIEYLLK